MGLKEFGKKLNDSLNKLNEDINNLANSASDQLNAGLSSLDGVVNGGLNSLGQQVRETVGVSEQVTSTPMEVASFNETAVEGLHEQNEINVQDIIREPVVSSPVVATSIPLETLPTENIAEGEHAKVVLEKESHEEVEQQPKVILAKVDIDESDENNEEIVESENNEEE